MAYWIQEIGNGHRPNWRMYHCDYVSDIQNLPLNDRNGVQQGDDTVSSTNATYGDQCLVLENSSVYELGKETNNWVKL